MSAGVDGEEAVAAIEWEAKGMEFEFGSKGDGPMSRSVGDRGVKNNVITASVMAVYAF
jgi:hypothetical protein